MSPEREARLVDCNRRLVLELNHVGRQLAVAEKGMRLLDSVAGDWNEAREVVAAWRKLGATTAAEPEEPR